MSLFPFTALLTPVTVLFVVQLLLVEDDIAIRDALARALSERGHVVTSTPAAMAALQQILKAAPDAVLLDLGLPDLGGQEALRMIRSVSTVPPVVPGDRGGAG